MRIAAALLLLATVASAHQQKEAITQVLFNPRTGNVEVMHRFVLHDAEHAVRELFDGAVDIIGSGEDRERFARYVYARFTIAADSQELTLKPVGSEIDGRFLWVYAEAPIPAEAQRLTIEHQALRDLWPDQTNLVNIERGGETTTLLFQGQHRALTAPVPHAHPQNR